MAVQFCLIPLKNKYGYVAKWLTRCTVYAFNKGSNPFIVVIYIGDYSSGAEAGLSSLLDGVSTHIIGYDKHLKLKSLSLQ